MNSRGKWFTKTVYYLTKLIASEFLFRLQQLINLKILPKGMFRLLNVFLQDYSGHITIKFSPTLGDYINVLSNPSKELATYFRDQGLKASFTEMSRIRVFMKIEKAITQAIRQLKGETSPQSRRLSVVKEQDRDDSTMTDRTRGRSFVDDAHYTAFQEYANAMCDKRLEQAGESPDSDFTQAFDAGHRYLRKKSTDSFSSLTSLGGTLL